MRLLAALNRRDRTVVSTVTGETGAGTLTEIVYRAMNRLAMPTNAGLFLVSAHDGCILARFREEMLETATGKEVFALAARIGVLTKQTFPEPRASGELFSYSMANATSSESNAETGRKETVSAVALGTASSPSHFRQ
jgi:hypothetical protein